MVTRALFLAFAFQSHESGGGMGDFIGTFRDIETAREAIEKILDDDRSLDCGQIAALRRGKLVVEQTISLWDSDEWSTPAADDIRFRPRSLKRAPL